MLSGIRIISARACVRPFVHTATGQDAELTDDAVPHCSRYSLPSGGSTERAWRIGAERKTKRR